MEEIKIRSDNKISVGANIKRIRQAKGVRAYDLIVNYSCRVSILINSGTINWNMTLPMCMLRN